MRSLMIAPSRGIELFYQFSTQLDDTGHYERQRNEPKMENPQMKQHRLAQNESRPHGHKQVSRPVP
jgi:hypothetical protein